MRTWFVLGGYLDGADLEERCPDWEPDDEYLTVDAAVVGAREWLGSRPSGLVEVIEFRGSNGAVVRLVTATKVEAVESEPWPPPREHGWLRRWIETPIGLLLLAAAFVATGIAIALDSDAPPGTRLMGVVGVGFFGLATIANVASAIRKRQGTYGER